MTQKGLAIKMEEKVPAIIPTISGNVNSRNELTPIANNTTIENRVVTDVLIERVIDCHTLSLTTSAKSSFLDACLVFSLILSKITMVSLIEYPIIVNIAAIKEVLTGIWKIA